ncbi:MAG: hypothetical protein IKO44_02115 [Ruminococcus sp.]|nr:hypothetical protein [Ruminococcus sp.]
MLVAALIFIFGAVTAFAEDEETEEITQKIDSGIRAGTDEDAAGFLDEHGISVSDPEGVSSLSPSEIFASVWQKMIDGLFSSRILLGKLMAICILCTVAESLFTDRRGLATVGNTAVLLIITAVYDSLSACIVLCRSTLSALTTFMLSYLPICSSVSAASGNAAAGASFYTSTIFLCEVIAFVTSKLLAPAVSVLVALTIAGSAEGTLELGSAAAAFKRLTTVLLSAFMCIFTGYMAVSGSVTSASDTMRARGIRFAASSFIPVIGGAVSESYGTVKQSLSVIRTSVGAVGIIIIAATVLPPLIHIAVIKLTISIAKLMFDMFGQKNGSRLLEGLGSVLSVILSIMICFSLMFITATGCMLAFSSGS